MDGIGSNDLGSSLAALLEALEEDLEQTANSAVARMIGELHSYRDHQPEELLPVIAGNLRASLADIAGVSDAPADRAAMHRETGRTRAVQGVSVEDMLYGWRIGVEELRASARTKAAERAIPDATVLEFTDLALAWADRGMLATATAHRLTELDLARHEQHARANVVRSLLMGSPTASELKLEAIAFGLDPGAIYVPFRARVTGQLDVGSAERLLGVADGAAPRYGLAALIDGDLAGFSSRLPMTLPESRGLVVGVGISAPLDMLAVPFMLATRSLNAAMLLGRTGITRFSDLGVHPAVLEDDDVARVLVEQIAAPVLRHGATGRTILETVDRYLANDRRLKQTAAELHTHVNTVRNRIQRFEQLSGRQLRCTADLVETWWVLKRLATIEPTQPRIKATTGIEPV